MEKTRVAAYIRVSTQEQAEEGFSLDSQLENIKLSAEKDGKTVVAVYTDKGVSGKETTKRFDLQKLLSDSSKDIFDEVYVWKTSRIARNVLNLLQIIEKLEKNNIVFKSITEPYDTSTPTSKLLVTLLGSVAEFERTTTIENLKMGMNARARQGLKNGGRMLGYKSEGKGKGSRLVIVPEEALLVEKIFNMYLNGKGYKAITNQLNREGYKTVRDNLFSILAVRDIINNPTYAGKITFNKLVDYSTKRRKGKNKNYIIADGVHEPIISIEVWDKVQAIRSIKEDKYPRRTSGEFPLSGLLKCPVCGYSMGAARTTNKLKDGTKRRIRYYTCGQFRNKGAVACSANSVRADKAEEYVFNRIQEVLFNEKILKDIVEKINSEEPEDIELLKNELNRIQKEMEKQKSITDRLFDLYQDGNIDKLVLNERLEKVEEAKNNLIVRKSEIDLRMARLSKPKVSYEDVNNVMKDFKTLLYESDPMNRKLLLSMIIEKITVGDNRKIDTIKIYFNNNVKKAFKEFLGEESSSDDEDSFFEFSVFI